MELPLYQVDAFTNRIFSGNPAAVVLLDDWLPDTTLQAIAAENNLSETSFFVRGRERPMLRWFTPCCEVKLCGHGTLAAGWVYFHHVDPRAARVVFDSQSGPLTVSRQAEQLTLDFPRQQLQSLAIPAALGQALGAAPVSLFAATDDWLALFADADSIRALQPRFELLKDFPCRGLMATAPGDDCDFVSRFFAPRVGIDEDPVTGSAHTSLVPFWADRLGKKQLHARQLSTRGGELRCELQGKRVLMSGAARLYLQGTILLDDQTLREP